MEAEVLAVSFEIAPSAQPFENSSTLFPTMKYGHAGETLMKQTMTKIIC